MKENNVLWKLLNDEEYQKDSAKKRQELINKYKTDKGYRKNFKTVELK